MRQTSILEKLLPSIINVVVVFTLAIPFYFYRLTVPVKIILIVLFFIYNFIFLIFTKSGRDLGMILANSYWMNNYRYTQRFIYCILYTMSFTSLLFWIYFPFDLFLANMLLLQLPSILTSGITLHGLLAGGMVTIRRT